ncbi:MAG: ROK family protein [Mycoplasmataceae bacterium]|nr:ROK family protein [Mycoplasmataceae bacterium]
MKVISINLGSLITRWVIINEKYEILESGVFNTHFHNFNPDVTLMWENIYNKISNYKNDVDSICISTPGIVDHKSGEIIVNDTFKNYEHFNIKSFLREKGFKNIFVENDANCAILSEHLLEPVKSANDVAMIIIRRFGIGGGYIVNNHLHRGAHLWGGEVGRIFIKGEQWEFSGSINALFKQLNRIKGSKLSYDDFFDNIHDPKYRVIFEEWLLTVALGVINVIYIIDPELIVIGGKFIQNERFDLNLLIEKIKENIEPSLFSKLKIIKSKHGANSSLIGAASLYFNPLIN